MINQFLISYKVNLNSRQVIALFKINLCKLIHCQKFHICFLHVRGAKKSFWSQEIKRADHCFSSFEQERLDFKFQLPGMEENGCRFKKVRSRDAFQREYRDIAKPNFLLYSTSIYQTPYSCMLSSG